MFDHCPSISLRSKTYDEVENSCCRDLQRQISFSQMQTSILLLLLPALCLAYTWEQVLEYYITQSCLSVRIVTEGWSFIKVLPGRDR